MSDTIRAGAMLHDLIIESKTTSTDANGNRSEAWSTHLTCWGSIEAGRGREFWSAKSVVADLSHTITIRYTDSLNESMRVKYVDPKSNRTRYFNIRSIASPDERTHMLILLCTEVGF